MEDIHLPRPQPKIRLLRINEVESDGESISCTVRHRRADDRYVCLSYCWGDDEPEHSITVNGKRHPVRQNLFKFLHTARRYKFDVLLWIDAISINQEDDHEKAIHIPAMATIFSEAEFVVVWLGLGDEDLHLLARMHDVAAFNDGQVPNLSARVEDDPSAEQTVYRRYSQEWHDTFDLKGNGRLKFKPWLNILGPVSFTAPKAYEPCSDQGEWLFSMYGHQLLRLACLNGYWRRAWICQELSMARHAWLLTPPASNPIEVRVLLELLSCHVWAMNQKREPLVDNDAHTEESLRTLRDVVGERSRCDLGRMLAMTSKMQCRFKRDRLFSVLSMAEEGKSFMATYAESDEMLMINAIGVAFTQHVEKFLSRHLNPRSWRGPALHYGFPIPRQRYRRSTFPVFGDGETVHCRPADNDQHARTMLHAT